MNSIDLKRRALELSEKTDNETISPTEVGGIMYDTVAYMEDVEINGSNLGIRKTYATVSAMEADQDPRDDKDGSPLRRGMLVNIYNQAEPESADNGKVFSWQNPGWAFRTKIDAGYATKREINELNISALYPTNGEGGTNRYTLAGAIAQVSSEYRVQGVKVSFVNENNETETWEYKGTAWVVGNFEEVGAHKILEVEFDGKVCKNETINQCLELYISSGITDATKVRFQIAASDGKLTQIALYNADSSVNKFIGQVINNQGLAYNEVIKFTEMNQSGLLAYVIIHDYTVTGLIESLPVPNVYLLNNVLNSQYSPNIQSVLKIRAESEVLEESINGVSNDLAENYIQKKVGKNLFNPYDTNCVIGKYIGYNGVITNQELVSITGRLPVKNGQIIKCNKTNFPSTYWNNFFLFDENDNLLDKHNGQSYTIDNEKASYLRMNIYVLNTDAWDATKPVGERNLGFPSDLMICIVDGEDEDLGEYEAYVINTDIQRAANDYTDKEIVKLKEEIEGEAAIKQIPCIGDSLTMGAGSGDYFNKTYPARLQQLCEEKGITDVKFTNCGVGGETIAAIAARQGSIPMLTKDDITIPASSQESVNVSFKSAWGGIYERFPEKTFTFQGYTVPDFNNIRINPCYIGGVEGELSFVSANVFSFKRKESGTEKTIKSGTPIICNMSKEFLQPYAAIFEVGANGCYDDTSDYLAQARACVNYYNTPNYIVIGCHYVTDTNTHPEYKSTLSDREEQESAFVKEFGVKFLNLRRLLNEHGIEYAKQLGLLADDYVPTEDDTAAMSKGQCPPVFLSDGIHFNDIGYNLKTHFIFDRMEEVGIL